MRDALLSYSRATHVCAHRADPSMRLLSLVCDSEQAASAAEAKILAAALPAMAVGCDSSRVLVRGSIRSILRLFGVDKSNARREVGSMLCTEINKKKPLCPSTVSKTINKKKSGGEQTDNCAEPMASPLTGLTFGADSSIKPLPEALPPTALWVYMNHNVPNDPRLANTAHPNPT
jgi:hypothetical protein